MSADRRKLQKELAQHLREKDSAALSLLRAQIKSARVERRHERTQEDDDAVRSNLPPELVPVFERHRRAFKGSAKRSRTEAFLEWAEENPDEILAVQQAEADKGLRNLLKQQREFGRTVRNARRYKQTPEELAQILAAVPF